MNQLTKHLVDGILNEDKQEVIGIYADFISESNISSHESSEFYVYNLS